MNSVHGHAAALLACPDTTCGQPRSTPGRPRSGWLQVRPAASTDPAPWFCSWHCLSRHALKAELNGGQA